MLQKFALNKRTIFLVDGIGALLSALLLTFILVPFEKAFGMPKSVICPLSIPAFVFAIYSFSAYLLNLKKWKVVLTIIMIANCLYCIITLSLLVLHYHSLTILGFAYFLGEIVIILFVARIEWMLIKANSYL